MAYRVIFWRRQTIRAEVLSGGHSELHDDFQAKEMFAKLRSEFAESRVDENGVLHWSDDIDNGLVVRCGDQFVEVCSFDLADADLERVFSVATDVPCEHYDWGN